MLKKQFQRYIENQNNQKYPLFSEEKAYVFKQSLLGEAEIALADSPARFQNLYLELVNKESDERIQDNINLDFLSEKMNYFEQHLDHYLYLETDTFEIIGIDGLIFEVDSVFRTYEVIFGLKLPKKLGDAIRSYFNESIKKEGLTYNLLFNDQEGLWEVNFPIEALNTFSKDMEINEALQLVYLFLFQMEDEIEDKLS
ncbi:hypothetical protein [Niallia sp. 01092]|uniref:hypothetical protein n=1 Tax=unclassified Niallia TaxID=2837522 RepID=UPI003FD04985